MLPLCIVCVCLRSFMLYRRTSIVSLPGHFHWPTSTYCVVYQTLISEIFSLMLSNRPSDNQWREESEDSFSVSSFLSTARQQILFLFVYPSNLSLSLFVRTFIHVWIISFSLFISFFQTQVRSSPEALCVASSSVREREPLAHQIHRLGATDLCTRLTSAPF